MRNDKKIALALIAATIFAIGVTALMLAGAFRTGQRAQPARIGDERLAGFSYRVADFGDLDGWRTDDVAETIPVFIRSCAMLANLSDETPVNPSEIALPGAREGESLAGVAGDWREACAAASNLLTHIFADDNARVSAVRSFYEYHFRPVRLYNLWRRDGAEGAAERLSPEGLFTAYFEPFYPASGVWTAEFSAPVYSRPDDLVSIDLGRFRPELAGQRLAGRLNGRELEPYPDHAAINSGVLVGRARVMAYMRPDDLFFLQVQGSGRLVFADRTIRVGYDGGNGQPYTAIGRVLVERGDLDRENVSMGTILDWLRTAPEDEARTVREANKSYVFFKEAPDLPDDSLGPIGSQGVQLTAGRSLAVDPRYTPYGAPVWISIPGDEAKRKEQIRRLMIAQDSGGAIKGAVRGDIFVGSGDLAGEVAGGFNERGEMFVFLPVKVAARLSARPRR